MLLSMRLRLLNKLEELCDIRRALYLYKSVSVNPIYR